MAGIKAGAADAPAGSAAGITEAEVDFAKISFKEAFNLLNVS